MESYDLLMEFAQKHLPDPFYLENEQRISLRGVICREMVSNILIHREFSSSYPAKFVIENNRIYTENANRASWSGEITLENFEPNPKIQSSPPFSAISDWPTNSVPVCVIFSNTPSIIKVGIPIF